MSRIFTRRLDRELEELSCSYIVYSVDATSQSGIINITIDHNNDIYVFGIPKFYPFKPPFLHINGLDIISVLHSYQNFLLEIGVKKHTECICMNSLFCGNNWSPKIKIEDLIQEVEREKRLIQKKYKIKFIKPILIKNNIYEDAILNIILSFYHFI
tara:strand:- start:6247 stop:6714 length:468 start_codon:yes stop_codon:yes gene_type:complete